MARRLDIELTSDRGDGQWTWRAAGAKQPKGTLDGSLLPAGTSVGDVVKVEADADLDGLTVTTVFAPKGARKEAETLEVLGSGRESLWSPRYLHRRVVAEAVTATIVGVAEVVVEAVTATIVGVAEVVVEAVTANAVVEATDAMSGPPRAQKPPARPKAPRLRPARTHREAALKALPTIQQPLAEEVLKGGVPGVRQAIDRMNDKATAEGMPKIKREPLVALAEKLAPTLKAAEWRDRAEAAVAGMETVDLATSAPWWWRPMGPPVTKRPGRLPRSCEKVSPAASTPSTTPGGRTRPDHRRGPYRACAAPQQPPAEGRCSASRRHGGTPGHCGVGVADQRGHQRSLRHRDRRRGLLPRPDPGHGSGCSRQPERRAHQGHHQVRGPHSADRSPVRYRSAGAEAAWEGQAPDAATSAAVGCTCPAEPAPLPPSRCSGCRRGGVTDHRSR